MTIERLRCGEKLSRIVIHQQTVYLCGQVALDYDADLTTQTQQVCARIDEHLAEAGTDKSNLLAATVYIKDITQVKTLNAVWNDWLSDVRPPSRTCVQADMGNEKILVEITCIAAKP